MRVILATNNKGKVEQIMPIFAESGIELITQRDAGIEGEALENGKTLEENSYKKAHYAWGSQYGRCVVSEDTGLFIDALGGKPGVDTAYWAGHNKTDEEVLAFALEALKGVADEKRTATFRTVATVIGPHGQLEQFEGRLSGFLLREPKGVHTPKLPFSSLFVPNGMYKALAQMPLEQENLISHRGLALAKVRYYLLTGKQPTK